MSMIPCSPRAHGRPVQRRTPAMSQTNQDAEQLLVCRHRGVPMRGQAVVSVHLQMARLKPVRKATPYLCPEIKDGWITCKSHLQHDLSAGARA